MIQPIVTILTTLCLTAASLSLCCSNAQAAPPLLNDFAVSTPASATQAAQVQSIARLAPARQPGQSGHWLVLVVDAQTDTSQQLMRALQQEKLASKRIVVVVLGGEVAAQSMITQAAIAEARYVRAENAIALAALQLNGTPAIFGIDAKKLIIWKHFGAPKRTSNLIVRILDWLGE